MIKILITGNSQLYSLALHNLANRISNAIFEYADTETTDKILARSVSGADYVVLLHEMDTASDYATCEENVYFTKQILELLINSSSNATVAYFSPRKRTVENMDTYGLKLQGENMLREYERLTKGRIVLYKLPEIFGPYIDNQTLDRLIETSEGADLPQSYEFLHSEDLFEELYRMINGAPAKIGYDNYAVPSGSHFSSDKMIIKLIEDYNKLDPCEVPELTTPFDLNFYDYYLRKINCSKSYKLGNKNEITVLSNPRVGAASVLRLGEGEEEKVTIGHLACVRVLVLSGIVQINRRKIEAENDVMRVDINKDTTIKNIGREKAIVQLWRYKGKD
ncbi:MAG: hypothetical protein PHE51_07250 [Eubacteriales bacterium]|nr:hypothetical protein [Eubacteriales bacterium]